MSKLSVLFILIVLMTFSGCSQNKKEVVKTNAIIIVELNENSEFIFNDRVANLDDFSQLVEKRVNELMIDGLSRDEIVISFKVADNVKMGLVADLQEELRQLDVRKISYARN